VADKVFVDVESLFLVLRRKNAYADRGLRISGGLLAVFNVRKRERVPK
jgi:hypothetical protein